MNPNELVRKIEAQKVLEQVGDPLQRTVKKALARVPQVANVLHGTWLGHPLHAAIVNVPLGSFTAATIFDISGALSGRRYFRQAARATIGVGLAGVGVAAFAGLADWSDTSGIAKRVGVAHAVLNTVAGALFGASYFLRRKKGVGWPAWRGRGALVDRILDHDRERLARRRAELPVPRWDARRACRATRRESKAEKGSPLELTNVRVAPAAFVGRPRAARSFMG